MSQVVEEVGIEHLDFDFDDDDFHYLHPTDPSLRWCGQKAKRRHKYSENNIDSFKAPMVECRACYELACTVNWWRIHRGHFDSLCTPDPHFHDCGA